MVTNQLGLLCPGKGRRHRHGEEKHGESTVVKSGMGEP
jgi:hypothetical protein